MSTARPNILLVTTDQHRPDFMHCAGHPQLQTPNLDRLATSGVLFDSAYCTTPLCTPARASILSGQMPSRHRGYTIGVDTPEPCTSVAQSLTEAGYHTALLGKAHFKRCGSGGTTGSPPRLLHVASFRPWPGPHSALHAAHPALRHTPEAHGTRGGGGGTHAPRPGSFELAVFRPSHGPYSGFQDAQRGSAPPTEAHSAGMHYRAWLLDHGVDPDLYFTKPGRPAAYRQIGHWPIEERYHPSAWLSGITGEYLEARAEDRRPFFCWTSFQDPHDPFQVPSPWSEMYKPEDVELLGTYEGEFDNKPPVYKMIAEGRFEEMPWHDSIGTPSAVPCWPEEDIRRRMTATYMGMVSLMDHHLGLILDKLEETGLAENTIVVFTSDHGDYLGHHGLRSKGLPAYDDVQRIPFIVRNPLGRATGQVSRQLVSQVDLAPTFLDWAGVEIPEVMQGNAMPEVLSGTGTSGARDELAVELRPVHQGISQKTLVTDKYKMVVYDHLDWGELYDRQADPDQLDNLYHNADMAAVKDQLLRRLTRCEMAYQKRRPPRTSYA